MRSHGWTFTQISADSWEAREDDADDEELGVIFPWRVSGVLRESEIAMAAAKAAPMEVRARMPAAWSIGLEHQRGDPWAGIDADMFMKDALDAFDARRQAFIERTCIGRRPSELPLRPFPARAKVLRLLGLAAG